MKEATILIPEPKLFFGEQDEDHFFAWLEEVPAVRDIKGTPDGLEIELAKPVDRVSFYGLVGLLTRYGLDRTSLQVLCEENEDPWFHDPGNYWFKSVFEDK
jgi:hypothetical protein